MRDFYDGFGETEMIIRGLEKKTPDPLGALNPILDFLKSAMGIGDNGKAKKFYDKVDKEEKDDIRPRNTRD